MGKPNKWRCGRRRYHDGEHAEWVAVEQYKKEKWRCGVVAQAPRAQRFDGLRWSCPWPDCGFIHPDPGPARGHWYNHIAVRTFSAEHGTVRGYENHRRLGEEACASCKAAHSEYNSRRQRGWVRRHPRPRGYGLKE